MNNKELRAALEAVLFACGEPIELSRLAEALDLDLAQTRELLEDYGQSLDEEGRGVCLLRLEDQYQLASREQYIEIIRSVLQKKRNTALSQAALEVLAIIAYNQPVTKAFAEQVRGVDCTGVISTLVQRDLIEEKGRLDLPGRPLVYCTTTNFLRCFSISDLSELPKLPQGEGEDEVAEGARIMEEAIDQLSLDSLI